MTSSIQLQITDVVVVVVDVECDERKYMKKMLNNVQESFVLNIISMGESRPFLFRGCGDNDD